MKVAIINKSDATGGAAIVSLRLLNALRKAGVDARMFVTEKHSTSDYVSLISSPTRAKISFIAERLKIFLANGMNRATLFKIDTCSDGLPLHDLPFIKEADIICLNWVNQGILSLREISRLAAMGKKIVWTMHDTWCFTGVCHYNYDCNKYVGHCDVCPILGDKAFYPSLAVATQKRKKQCYERSAITFVAVSDWLADLASQSPLFNHIRPAVIPNAFPIDSKPLIHQTSTNPSRVFKILFGAARLDDPVKGLPTLVEVTRQLAERSTPESPRFELITFGEAKDPTSLDGIAIPVTHLGRVSADTLPELYGSADILISTAHWETLPTTLVEGQAYGCIPVALNHGGQSDIITHHETGYLAEWNADISTTASNLVDGLMWAANTLSTPDTDIIQRMHANVYTKFNESVVAQSYISLFNSLLSK